MTEQKKTIAELREESVHVAVGRVFEMTAAICDTFSDAIEMTRDRMRAMADETNARRSDEYLNASRQTYQLEQDIYAKFKREMGEAMNAGYRAIFIDPNDDAD